MKHPWRLWLAGWLVALLLVMPYVLTTRHLPDEFAFCNVAVRLAHGDVFGRDVFCFMMPGPFALTAVVFKLFGPSLFAARLLQACLIAAMAVVYWRLARALGVGRWLAPVPALIQLVVILGAYPTFSHRWFSQALVAFSLALVWRALGRGGLMAWGIAGVAAGLTYVMQQLDGAALAGGLGLGVLALAWHERWPLGLVARRLGVALAGWVVPVGLLVLVLWLQGGLAEAFYDTHTWPIAHYRARGNPNDVTYMMDLSLMLSTTGTWISRLYWYASAAVVLVGTLMPMAVSVLGVAWFVGLRRRERTGDRQQAFLVVLAGVVLMFFLSALRGRADATHVLAVSMPMFLLVTATIVRWETLGAAVGGLRWAPRAALVGLLLAGAVRAEELVRAEPSAWLSLSTPDARLRRHPSLEAVARLLKPGDYLLAGVQSAIYNFYLAPNPTRWVIDWEPPASGYTTAAQFAEMRADVRKHPTRVLVVSTTTRAAADQFLHDFLDDYTCTMVVPNPVPFNPVPYVTGTLQTYVYTPRSKPSRKATM